MCLQHWKRLLAEIADATDQPRQGVTMRKASVALLAGALLGTSLVWSDPAHAQDDGSMTFGAEETEGSGGEAGAEGEMTFGEGEEAPAEEAPAEEGAATKRRSTARRRTPSRSRKATVTE